MPNNIQIEIQKQLYDLQKNLHDGIYKSKNNTKIDTKTLFDLANKELNSIKSNNTPSNNTHSNNTPFNLSEAEAFAIKYQNFMNIKDYKIDFAKELEKAKELLAIVTSMLVTEIAASSIEVSIMESGTSYSATRTVNSNQSSIHEHFIASILPNDTILTDSKQNTGSKSVSPVNDSDIALGSIASTIATIISSIVLSSGLSSGPIQSTTPASSGPIQATTLASSGPIQGTTIGTIIESATSIIDTSIIEKMATFTSEPNPSTTATSGPIPGTVKTVALSSNKNFDLNKPFSVNNIDATLEVLHKLVILGGTSDVAAPELKTYIISKSKTDIMEGHFIVTGHLRCIDGIVIPPSLSDIDHIFVGQGNTVKYNDYRHIAISHTKTPKNDNYMFHYGVDSNQKLNDEIIKKIHKNLNLNIFCTERYQTEAEKISKAQPNPHPNTSQSPSTIKRGGSKTRKLRIID